MSLDGLSATVELLALQRANAIDSWVRLVVMGAGFCLSKGCSRLKQAWRASLAVLRGRTICSIGGAGHWSSQVVSTARSGSARG
jgi:hypothetical protein